MWRIRFASLRSRMALLLAVSVAVTLAAALALTWALGIASRRVETLAAAQERLDLLSAVSGRTGEYALLAFRAAADPAREREPLRTAHERVRDAFSRLDAALGRDVARSADSAGRALIAARGRILARMWARFDLLDRQVTAALKQGVPGDPEAVRTALDAFAAAFGPLLGSLIEDERAGAQRAQAAMVQLRDRLLQGAAAAVLLALLIAALLYRTLVRPLLRRISEVAHGAAAVAHGRFDTRLSVHGHDELSLAMAHFNRMAARLAREQQRLQETISARTAELRAANERLAEVDSARRRFFTDVSHELRTPLTVILGEAEVTLRARNPGIEALRSALSTIRARARRLHRRVEDLLRIARSESGQIELDLAAVEVGTVLEEAREGIEGLARSAGVTVSVDAAPELRVEADREWLRQVVEGLLGNAIRHSGPDAGVRLVARGCGPEVEIAVEDEGSGIPPEALPHVFERFYRGQDDRPGFGIGLALGKWVVEQHGGAISLESGTEPGRRGTTVRIRLPALAAGRARVAAR